MYHVYIHSGGEELVYYNDVSKNVGIALGFVGVPVIFIFTDDHLVEKWQKLRF